MSLTYPANTANPLGEPVQVPPAELAHDEPFVPVYARRGRARGGQGKIRTWMILVPVGVLTLGGIGAMMAMNGGDEAPAPLAEAAATLPVLATTTVPIEPAVATLATAASPAPVIAAPIPRAAPAPARRAAAAEPAPAATTDAQTPVVPTGPQPYAPAPASPSTILNTAPAATVPASAPTPPVIVVEPVG